MKKEDGTLLLLHGAEQYAYMFLEDEEAHCPADNATKQYKRADKKGDKANACTDKRKHPGG
ncbi:hypothetical protein KSF_091980 [Reticulibacter mediterranei]|uniref:Uncharacterized protein n=1 Tax=Reticulibacter mediterranei TaxID=2778369 RepID=A0A8J3IYL1_9CHLR|nr:hypothetical protein KSF_091980 [Reticulibacter mediterranei]